MSDLVGKEFVVVATTEDGDYTTVRELIRCIDCKYSSPNQVYGCRIRSFADDLDKRMYAGDYCSMAERKE